MSAIANAFKRAAGVAEKDIVNEYKDPHYVRLVAADKVMGAKSTLKQSQKKKNKK